MPNTLKIIQLNVNSLVSKEKRHSFENFLKIHKPTAVLLNETKLKKQHKLNFNNYNFIRNDRTTDGRGGGTGIVIRDNIKFTVVNNPKTLRSIESTIIAIESGNKKIFLVSVYYSYGFANLPLDTEDMNRILGILKFNNNNDVIIGGDFNAKNTLWLNTMSQSNTDGKKLHEWYIQNALNFNIKLRSSLLPTCHFGNTSSYLDIFFISRSLNISFDRGLGEYLGTLDFNSDHKAVVVNLKLGTAVDNFDPIIVPNYSAANWKSFNRSLDSKLSTIDIKNNKNMSSSEIDIVIDQLNYAFQQTIKECIPTTIIRNKSTQLPLTEIILKVIALKKTLRRKLYCRRYKYDAYQLRSQISCLTVMIKNMINTHYNNIYKKRIESIKLNNNTFKQIKNLTGYRAREDISTIIHPNRPDQIATSNIDKANILAEYFQSVHADIDGLGDPKFSNEINNHIRSLYNNNFEALVNFSRDFPATTTNAYLSDSNTKHFNIFSNIAPFYHNSFGFSCNPPNTVECYNKNNSFITLNELKFLIKCRRTKKSCGPDGIPNIILKQLSDTFLIFIVGLFNQMYNIAYYPKIWKAACVIPINKPGKPSNRADSYRPITLTSTISKLFEKFILQKINDHCDNFNIIPENQFGFRKHTSTVHALTKFREDVCLNLNNKIPTVVCSLDIEKAFDKTWIEGLIYKMKYVFGFDEHICKIIYSFLINREFYVKLGETLSNRMHIEAGIPQGAVLSATLFLIYHADFPPPPPTIFSQIKRIHYADDVLLYIASKNLAHIHSQLNKYLKIIEEYLFNWKSSINQNKSTVIIIKGHYNTIDRKIQNQMKNFQLKINNKIIKPSNNFKYLGLIITNRLSFIPHIDNIIKRATLTLLSLRPLITPNGVDKKIKILCYKQLIRPILCYGFPIWFDISSHQMERLRVFERKCIRACINYKRQTDTNYHISNDILYDESSIARIDRFLVTSAIKYLKLTTSHQNTIIKKYGSFPIQHSLEDSFKFKPPHTLLHLYQSNKLYDKENKLIYYHRPYNIYRKDQIYNTNQNITN